MTKENTKEKIIEGLPDSKIKIIRKGQDGFPWFLSNLKECPDLLYCIGDTSLLKKRAVAVVGARNCSQYGRQVALKVGETLANHGIVTVSGMATGIDGFAHEGALRAGGKTIAVLGCGVDVCYPRSNEKLYREITKAGLVISAYELGTRPRQWQFPYRNRIISALSEMVVVVEAREGSGSLITAVAGAEQGKEIMVAPGNINSPYSKGTNRLIADGASVMTEADDVLRALGIVPNSCKELMSAMGSDEKKIYEALLEMGEATLDDLSVKFQEDMVTIGGIITAMELKGLISYRLGKIFLANF